MKDTILFDFDGTIMDTNKVIIESWQHTYKKYRGKEGNEKEILNTFGEPLDLSMKKLFPEVDNKEAVDTYREYQYDNYLELITLCPGMEELIKKLKVDNYKIGLVTSRRVRTTMEGLEKYSLKDYFDVIITADDTTKHKPHPEPINIALKKLESESNRAIMIGDTKFDMQCAKNAGVESVLVNWAIAYSKEESDNCIPNHIINKAEELLEII